MEFCARGGCKGGERVDVKSTVAVDGHGRDDERWPYSYLRFWFLA